MRIRRRRVSLRCRRIKVSILSVADTVFLKLSVVRGRSFLIPLIVLLLIHTP